MAKKKTGWELVTLTPALAKLWLDSSKNVRDIDRLRVEQYKGDMLSGNWLLTHQGMTHNQFGMRDGFNRCTAVYESGVTIQVWVFWGVDEESVVEIDGGKPRSDTAALRAADLAVSGKTLAVLNGMFQFPAGNYEKQSRSTLQRALAKYKPALDFVAENCKSNVFTVPVRAAIARAYYHVKREWLVYFCQAMKGELDRTINITVSATTKLMHALANVEGGGRTPRVERYCLTQAAILRFVKQERVENLKMATDDRFPLPENP